MYKVIDSTTNQLLGFTNTLSYIYYDQENKLCLPFHKEGASGIVVDGTAYNITEERLIPKAPLIRIEEVDGGEYLFINHNETVKNSSDITTMQELILTQDNDMNALEEALMDLDNQMAGGE